MTECQHHWVRTLECYKKCGEIRKKKCDCIQVCVKCWKQRREVVK